MKAITTKYHGPTDTRGSRVSASDLDGNRITVVYRCELNSEENHMAAARALCEKLNWRGQLQGGHTRGGMVFVWEDRQNKITV